MSTRPDTSAGGGGPTVTGASSPSVSSTSAASSVSGSAASPASSVPRLGVEHDRGQVVDRQERPHGVGDGQRQPGQRPPGQLGDDPVLAGAEQVGRPQHRQPVGSDTTERTSSSCARLASP